MQLQINSFALGVIWLTLVDAKVPMVCNVNQCTTAVSNTVNLYTCILRPRFKDWVYDTAIN